MNRKLSTRSSGWSPSWTRCPQLWHHKPRDPTSPDAYRTFSYKFKGDKNKDNELNINMSGLIAGIGVTF